MLTPFRVTDARDGELVPRMYSYWSNAVIRDGAVLVFNGHADGTVHFWRVDIASRQVDRLGALLTYTGEGEGWFWDREGRLIVLDGPRLRRVGPFSPDQDEVVLDISETHPGCDLWQPHASEDGSFYSATVRQLTTEGPYQPIGTVVGSMQAQRFYRAEGELDESAIDASGRFLLIKETFQRDKPRLDNRILDFERGTDRWLRDEDGAIGHADMGAGFVVGEDDQAGACVRLDLDTFDRVPLFSTWNMGYVSVRGERCLWSSDTHISLVALDGSGVTPLVEHGAHAGNEYDQRVKASLDPSGRVACYMVRGTVYLLELP